MSPTLSSNLPYVSHAARGCFRTAHVQPKLDYHCQPINLAKINNNYYSQRFQAIQAPPEKKINKYSNKEITEIMNVLSILQDRNLIIINSLQTGSRGPEKPCFSYKIHPSRNLNQCQFATSNLYQFEYPLFIVLSCCSPKRTATGDFQA